MGARNFLSKIAISTIVGSVKLLSVVVASEPVTDPPVPLNIPPIDNRIAGHPSELVGA